MGWDLAPFICEARKNTGEPCRRPVKILDADLHAVCPSHRNADRQRMDDDAANAWKLVDGLPAAERVPRLLVLFGDDYEVMKNRTVLYEARARDTQTRLSAIDDLREIEASLR